jgi:hypothetical protein
MQAATQVLILSRIQSFENPKEFLGKLWKKMGTVLEQIVPIKTLYYLG